MNCRKEPPLVRADLKTPKAAAIAGVLFSLLLAGSLWLLKASIPSDPAEIGEWLRTSGSRVTFALNLIPFAGIAFMWFLGVLRDRMGDMEDQFFAIVFLSSGLLFLVMLFVSASTVGGLLLAYSSTSSALVSSPAFSFGRAFAYDLMRIYAFKMAAVFMATTSTLAWRIQFVNRWLALVGYVCAGFLLIGSSFVNWAIFVLPGWILFVSIHILVDDLRSTPPAGGATGQRR
jgi:hypothetical protein